MSVVVVVARGFHGFPLVLSVRGVCCVFGCLFGWRLLVASVGAPCWLSVSAVHEIAFPGE